MNILVTGGAGFIASHITDAYIAAGHDVAVIDDLTGGRRENVHPRATFYQMDIRDASVTDIFARHAFDAVSHHAAQMDVRRSVADPAFDASVNVLGGLNILEAARKHGVRKIIFASTGGAIYGEQDYFPADEEHPTRPLSPYGITKLTTEKYLFYYKAVYGMDAVILRYANVYGPRQNPHGEAGVVAIFASKLLKGEHTIINGDGKQTRDYTYVADVVQANLHALTFQGSEIFNVGTGVEHDVNYLFQHLARTLRPNAPEQHGPAKPGEQMRSVITSEKMYRTFGWRPMTSLEEGLRVTAEWFRTQSPR
ncbi:MAG: NAD-dependent epimerase/dehydratase family protein [Bacteroidota bacterium]